MRKWVNGWGHLSLLKDCTACSWEIGVNDKLLLLIHEFKMLFSLYNRELAKREALLTDNYCPNCLALLTAPSSLTGRIQIIAACQSNGGHLNILWEKFACNTREAQDLNTPAERQHWQAGLSRVQTPVEQHQEMAGGFLNGSRYTQASKVRRVAPAFAFSPHSVCQPFFIPSILSSSLLMICTMHA